MAGYVYISYARVDREVAWTLAVDLEAMHKEWPMGRSVVRWMRDQGY